MNKTLIAVLGVIVLLAVVVWWSRSMQSSDPSIISRNGLHWHPILEVYVNGEKQEMPANLGLGPQYASNPTFDRQMGMAAVHTHDDASQGVVHLEFSGIVREDDLTLKNFLDIWGKGINSFSSNVKMTVNGIENMELESYSMKDGDKIELRYE
ncbi:MAG: hypothetical protein Q8O98_00185 [bacterium]|nr:hypothetical protein [bacterium]